MEAKTTGAMICQMLSPLARRAETSPSVLSRPNISNVATTQEIGTVKDRM